MLVLVNSGTRQGGAMHRRQMLRRKEEPGDRSGTAELSFRWSSVNRLYRLPGGLVVLFEIIL
jgi:hypothetical protein